MSSLNMSGPLFAATLGLSALGASASPTLAAPAPAYFELLQQAQGVAPRLAEARADIARAEGLARQARVIPNPVLSANVENFSGSGPYRGGGLTESTYSVQQTLELGGKRSARIAAGRSEVAAATARARRAQVDYAFDLALAYAEAEAADRRLQVARDVLALTQDDARIANALVNAGREASLRGLQAEAAAQVAQAALDEAQAAQATAFANLTSLAGAETPITSISTSLLDRRDPGLAGLRPEAAATAAYLAAEAEQTAAARRLVVERRRAIPDVAVSVGVRQFEQDGASAVMAGASVPFPLFDRNRGNIAAARADVSSAQARLSAARLDAEAAVRTSGVRLAAAESRLAASQAGEQTAQEAYRLARIGYEAGKLPLIELVNVRRALADARTQTIAAAVERIGAQAAQARLGGFATAGDQQ